MKTLFTSPFARFTSAVTLGTVVCCAVATNVSAQTNCATPPSGLVGWWKGENNALDSAGTNNGTLAGNTTYGAGRVGQAFVFDGNHDGVQLANSTNLQLQNFTIEAWIRRSSVSIASQDLGGGELFSFGSGGYGLLIDNDGTAYLVKNNASSIASSFQITDTNWHHLAVTKSGTTVVFYLEGVAYPAASYAATFTFATSPAIGARGDNLANSFLGMVDEVSVYNRALATNEVQSIYNAGSSGKCLRPPPPPCATPPSGLVGWWKGESNALDSVGSNNGTLAGNTTYGSARVGQGFVFDGNHDGVQLANQTNLQLQNFSIEAWIKRSDASIASQDIGGGELFSFGSGGYGLLVDNDGHAYLVKNNASSVPSSFQITDTNWHHLAVTKSGTNVVFYLEGVAYPAAPYVVTFTFASPPAIGARGDNFANSFLGTVDEVSVYNRPLTAGEIQALYNADSSGKCVVPVAPFIISQPQNQTVVVGQTATFNVTATGAQPLNYQWRKNGSDLSDGGNVSGATGSALTLSAVSSGDAATYDVVVANAGGSITSAPAVLTVVVPPVIITQPQSQTNNAGATVTFNVVASGNFLTYQWRKGATVLVDGGKISGAQTPTLMLANVLFSDSGGYSVVVANSAGSATSDAATLTVDVHFPKNVYNGLFYDTNGVSHESSGFFTAKTTSKGAFSAKLQLAGKRYSSSGLFNADGRAVNPIARTGLSPLTIELNLDFSGKDQITGRVTDEIWSADLTADKALFNAVTNPAPQAGRYTMHIPGNPDQAESPGGDGFGTVTVNTGGKVSLKGTLGDGTKISQKTSLSKNGQWPFYNSIYKGSGSVLSWATFTNSGIKEFSGDMSWIKKANPLAKFYAAGFSNETSVAGSFYTPPLPGNRVLNFSDAIVLLTGGNLSQSFSNNATLGFDNKVTHSSTNKLSLTLTLPTGLFKGKATDPASGEIISFKGAVSQKNNSGSGFFPGTNQSGRVYFGE